MHLGDEVGASDGEQFIAALEMLPAKIIRGEILVLHIGAECAIEHHNAIVDGLDISRSFGGSHRQGKAKTSSVTYS